MHSDGTKRRPTTFQALEALEQRILLSLSYVEQPIPGNGGLGSTILEDLDNDGDIDFAAIVAANEHTSVVRVRLNNGDGSFGVPADYILGNLFGSRRLDSGDFNGDGFVDLITASSVFSGEISLGGGDGTFGAFISAGMGKMGVPWMTDFSGDGVVDIIDDVGDGTFRVAANTGNAWFPNVTVHSFGLQDAKIIGIADFDGDTIDDLAVYGSGSLQIWYGDGNDFAPGPVSLVASQPVVGDFDEDGLADIAWSTDSPSSDTSTVRRAINPGNGQFLTSSAVAESSQFWLLSHPQAIDLNGDGSTDLAYTSTYIFAQSGSVESRIVLFEGDGSGGFGVGVELFSIGDASVGMQGRALWADITGDGIGDGFVFEGNNNSLAALFESRASPPVIGSVAGPANPITPGSLFTISATGVTPSSGRTIATVQVFVDSNNNGFYDDGQSAVPDALYGNAIADGSVAGRWSLESMLEDGRFEGDTLFFVIATDSQESASEVETLVIDAWTRIYLPEGWRSDATVTEILNLSNMHNTIVDFRVVARYETGERDSIIASGSLTHQGQSQIVLSERGNPAAALVRAGVAYTIEVQMSKMIGATLLREENFGLLGELSRVTNVEALNTTSSSSWRFAEMSTVGHDFLLFYNPFERDISLTVTFTSDATDPLVVPYRLDAFRRGGLNLGQIAALAPDTEYVVEISSADPFAAVMSRYADEGRGGFTSLGQQHAAERAYNWAETGTGIASSVGFYNPQSETISIDVVVTFDDPLITVHATTMSVGSGEHTSLDLSALSPSDSTFAGLVMTGSAAFYSHTTTTSTERSEVIVRHSQSEHAWQWIFANTTAREGETEDWLTLTNSNDTEMRIGMTLYVAGTRQTLSVRLDAGQTKRINMHNLVFGRLETSGQYHFKMTGDRNFIASLSHVDLVSGASWETMGTNQRPSTSL